MLRYSTPFYSTRLNKTVKQVNKTTAEKCYENGMAIYITASNLSLDGMYFHPFKLKKGDRVEPTTFKAEVNEFKWYNCDSERGKYPVFFIESV